MPVFDPATSVALLVGIAEYKKTDLFGALPWVENNLKALTALLLDRDVFGFQAENVFERLNLNNGDIAEELDAIRGRPEPIDTLLVYLLWSWSGTERALFLTGSDAGRTSAQKLPFEEFERLFLQINAQRKILILDSCFSGRAISDHLTEETAS